MFRHNWIHALWSQYTVRLHRAMKCSVHFAPAFGDEMKARCTAHCSLLDFTTGARSARTIYRTLARPAPVSALTLYPWYKCGGLVSSLKVYIGSAFTGALTVHIVKCTNTVPVSEATVYTVSALTCLILL